MTKKQFYRFIEQGALQGASRYFEYWYVYSHLPDSGTALDLGSGTSMIPTAMKQRGLDVTITEADMKAIRFQEAHGIKCKLVTDEYLHFPDQSFDVVVSASAIEHFQNDFRIISEVHRVLKTGGKFIITLPVGDTYIENRYAGKQHPPERIYDKQTFYDRMLTKFMATENKFFQNTNKKPTDYIPHRSWGDKVSVEEVQDFAVNVGLCSVLIKL